MVIATLAFYLFSAVAVASALMVVLSRNPVHSVLWLILTFFSAAGLFVILGAEFVAMLLVIVYVGAVMVLFLFVVMMMDVDFAELKSGMSKYVRIGSLIGLVILMELLLATGYWSGWIVADMAPDMRAAITPALSETQNTIAIGSILYTQYVYLFQAAGLILLVAMIGAIVLTMRHRKDVKRQSIVGQIYRDADKAVEMIDVKPGQGL
ncbi:MAG TPA: NADH-quinone oxidoreductase subunit J [Rhodobacteraceae bacterium]|nr:NADH-quinone oxidoreductase subunit J [Paracoccaceae bacterium]